MRETQIKTTRRYHLILVRMAIRNFPGGPLVKNQPPNAGDTGWISSLRRFHTQPVQDNYCALALELCDGGGNMVALSSQWEGSTQNLLSLAV